MLTSRAVPTVLFCLRRSGQGNKKCGAVPGFRFHPDLSVVPLENALRDGEAQALAIAMRRIEAMEDFEYLSLMFRRDADAVVADGVDREAVFHSA